MPPKVKSMPHGARPVDPIYDMLPVRSGFLKWGLV